MLVVPCSNIPMPMPKPAGVLGVKRQKVLCRVRRAHELAVRVLGRVCVCAFGFEDARHFESEFPTPPR